jgi:hypothetical protein
MTLSTPGATEVMDQPLAPMTPEQAGARRAELTADPKFTERALAGGVAEQEMLRDLWLLERGHLPARLQPVHVGDVYAGMGEREIEHDKQRVETYAKDIIGFDDKMRFQIARGLATRQQHDTAVRELAKLKSDPAFVQRLLRTDWPDQDARDLWQRWNLIAALRVAPDDHDWSKG